MEHTVVELINSIQTTDSVDEKLSALSKAVEICLTSPSLLSAFAMSIADFNVSASERVDTGSQLSCVNSLTVLSPSSLSLTSPYLPPFPSKQLH